MAAITIQKHWRGTLDRRAAAKQRRVLEEKYACIIRSTVIIQKQWRRYRQQKAFKHILQSVIKLQACIRGHKARRKYLETKAELKRLQQERRIRAEHNAALKIQHFMKAYCARYNYKRIIKSVTTIQILNTKEYSEKLTSFEK